MGLGDRIKVLRKRKKVSQGELADACNISRQAVSRWETNDQQPTRDKLSIIAEVLGVTMADLVGVTIYPEQIDDKKNGAGFFAPSDLISLALVDASSLQKNDDGTWGCPIEPDDVDKTIPVPRGLISGRPIAVKVEGVNLKDIRIMRPVLCIVDTGVPVMPGDNILIRYFGVCRVVRYFIAGSDDIIIEDADGRERLTSENREDVRLEIIGKIAEIRA